MGYVSESARMANSYGNKSQVFYLVVISVLNSIVIQKFYGGKMTHLQFREQLIHDLVLAAEYRAVNVRGIQ
jgi:hypothetical protein